jgi:hypothetical protein
MSKERSSHKINNQSLDTMATISENIKRIRVKQRLMQDDLAKQADIKYSTFQKLRVVLLHCQVLKQFKKSPSHWGFLWKKF